MLTVISVAIDWKQMFFLKLTNCCNFDMNTELKMTYLMVGELNLLCC